MTASERRARRTAWLMLIPALVLLALMAGFPLVRTVQLAFTDADLYQYPMDPQGVGGDNFRDLWNDPDWWRAVRNTLVFTVASVTLETVLGLAVALLVATELRGRGLMRVAMLVPWAVPTVVAAQMWRLMFHDVSGVINDVLLRAGVLERPIAWLANPTTALPALIAIDVWKTTPFMALLLLAGLQSIPREMYEAADVDGAGPVDRFLHITLPLLKPALLVALVFRTLDALRVFDVIYVATGTNPSTMSMSVYARQQMIDFGALGYGSAVSLAIFAMVGLFTAAYVAVLQREDGQ